LKAFRDAIAMSQADLAEKLGCTRSYVSFVESGQKAPGLEFAVKLEHLTANAEGGPIRAADWID
jgi:transcriptional regulator with XRE-family HTH domain